MSTEPEKTTTVVSIEIELPLSKKIETLFLQAKMKGVKRQAKITKKHFYAYLLTTGVSDFDQEALEKFTENLNGK